MHVCTLSYVRILVALFILISALPLLLPSELRWHLVLCTRISILPKPSRLWSRIVEPLEATRFVV